MTRTLSVAAALVAAVLLLPAGAATAQTAEEILTKMDANMTFGTRITGGTMTISRADGTEDVKTMKMWGRGGVDSFVKFESPARDKGVKYLKLDDNLYMFLPRTGKVVKISGHLLRQSLMDSDFSYEDMMEARKLLVDYTPRIAGEETLDGEHCWVLELDGKREGVSYARRKIWVTKETLVPVKSELYAKSGMLMKVSTSTRIMTYGGRHYPLRLTMEDKLKKGSKTVMLLTDPSFDVDIPDRYFSRRSLMKAD